MVWWQVQEERKYWSTNLFFLLKSSHHTIRGLEIKKILYLKFKSVMIFNVYLICLHCSEGQVQVRTNQGLRVHQNDLLLCHGYLSCIVLSLQFKSCWGIITYDYGKQMHL